MKHPIGQWLGFGGCGCMPVRGADSLSPGLGQSCVQFDVIADSLGIQVLDYRYGDLNISATREDTSWHRSLSIIRICCGQSPLDTARFSVHTFFMVIKVERILLNR